AVRSLPDCERLEPAAHVLVGVVEESVSELRPSREPVDRASMKRVVEKISDQVRGEQEPDREPTPARSPGPRSEPPARDEQEHDRREDVARPVRSSDRRESAEEEERRHKEARLLGSRATVLARRDEREAAESERPERSLE